MGLKSKILFMLIIYFAGFATAIYYLAPNGRAETEQGSGLLTANAGGSSATSALDRCYERAAAKFSENFGNMDTKEFKEKFNAGMRKLMEMSKNSPSEKP